MLQVFIWLLRDNDLQGISFLDMHFYVHQLVGLRNLALAADLYHSVSLIRYQVGELHEIASAWLKTGIVSWKMRRPIYPHGPIFYR